MSPRRRILSGGIGPLELPVYGMHDRTLNGIREAARRCFPLPEFVESRFSGLTFALRLYPRDVLRELATPVGTGGKP